ncbi:helix-turn-helix domain-containing protein [Streptomyces sp. NPDC101175]|uniref:helix-turn-helix domain-containing protein n=1 Tax=Streptomyces sp. NPDC101175 TaxID=3366123 RepID=UPI0038375AEE
MREVAELLRVNKTTLYTHFIHTRRLATIQIGRRRLVPLAAVRDLIERLRAEGTQ